MLLVDLFDSTRGALLERGLANQALLRLPLHLDICRWSLQVNNALVGGLGHARGHLMLGEVGASLQLRSDRLLLIVGREFSLAWLLLRVVERELAVNVAA